MSRRIAISSKRRYWLSDKVLEAKGDKTAARAAYERARKWPRLSERLKKAINERISGLN
ncbi:MAG: hypothetical protein ACRCWJ_11195 [Casimicrobium sp.]